MSKVGSKIKHFLLSYKLQLICILGGFILFGIATVVLGDESSASAEFVERQGYGGYKSTAKVYVEGLSDEELLVDVPVSARKYTDEEIDAAYESCMNELLTQMLGDNASLQEVSSDLNLPGRMDKYGFRLTYFSSDPKLMSAYGEVHNADIEESKDITLTVDLSDGIHEGEYEVPIRIVKPILSPSQEEMKNYMTYVADIDEEHIHESGYTLPTTFNGRDINYRTVDAPNYNFIWICGIVLAALAYVKDKQKMKDEQGARDRQLQLDYPEIVSKLQVYIGAGMSVRMAIKSIVEDYTKSHTEDRYAYDELTKAYNRLQVGTQESLVYKDFGRACKTKQYMKLAGLLDQNRRTGLSDLMSMLSLETVEAWEERKNLARRMGEEAGTKLLIPLFIMLGIVMVMIMVPAMMTFY